MRKGLFVFGAALFVAASAAAQPSAESGPAPVRIILVGDSTVAPKNGWGPGFCAEAAPQITCVNVAKNGRSSSSYRAEGSWANVMDALKHNGDFRVTYVLIQFGHNDQPGKPGRSTDLEIEFPSNLRQYVQDVKATGAKPVLITPLTRRMFQGGVVKNDLDAWGDAAKKIAADEAIPVLDLNSDSTAAVQKMGPAEANTLAMAPPPPAIAASAANGNSIAAPRPAAPVAANAVERKGDPAPLFDYTHLGEKGSSFFGHMVVGELIRAVPELRAFFNP